MGGDKGGEADKSGMYAAMASAAAADKAYKLGEENLQWAKEVWAKEQPLMEASEQQQMDLSKAEQDQLTQMTNEGKEQWQDYMDTYQPLEAGYVEQVKNWDTPQAIAEARGSAMADVAEQGQAGLNTAAETLRGYGINPGSGRYAGLYAGAQPMLGAAEAAAGTTAARDLRSQKMGLEAGAINTGRGLVNATQGLAGAGTGAANSGIAGAGGAANTANSNLSTGSTAMTNPTQWFNAGSNAMNSYVGAVNGYNDSNAKFAEAANAGMGGIGSAIGGIAGMAMKFGYAEGGAVDGMPQPQQGGGQSGIPSSPIPPSPHGATTGGTVPTHDSPSMGVATDDVPAMLTANEFVIPKDVATWKGHEYFAKQIDAARRGQQQFSQRDDIGGEPTNAIPQSPTFVSRPVHTAMGGGAIPGMPG